MGNRGILDNDPGAHRVICVTCKSYVQADGESKYFKRSKSKQVFCDLESLHCVCGSQCYVYVCLKTYFCRAGAPHVLVTVTETVLSRNDCITSS